MAEHHIAVTIRLPAILKRQALLDARQRGMSVTSLVKAALGRELAGEPPRWWTDGVRMTGEKTMPSDDEFVRGSTVVRAGAAACKKRAHRGATALATLTVRLPRPLLAGFKKAAAARAMSKTRLLREALENETRTEPPAWWTKYCKKLARL